MKKSIIILLLFVVLLGFNFNVLASESTLISKAAQELVINSDLSSQEIKDLQMKLNKQLNANIDSEILLEILENKKIEIFIVTVNKIEVLKSNGVSSDYINQFLDQNNIEELNTKKIIDEYKSSNEYNEYKSSFNTRQLRVNADYRVNVSDIRPETGEMYWVPSNKLGMPDTTLEELKELKGKPKELQEEIDVLYEALAYIQISKMEIVSGNIKIRNKSKDISWQFPAPAEYSIKENKANCVGITNVINYLLKDDYEEIGGAWYHRSFIIGDKRGGHIINYIKHNDKYYIFDALGYIHDRDAYSSPENGDTYKRGHIAGCIHEIANNENGEPNFKPYVDFWRYYNENMAFMVLVPMDRFPVMGSSIASHNHDTDVFISDRADLDEIIKIYDNPEDPQVLIEEEVLVDPPQEYENYKPYNNM